MAILTAPLAADTLGSLDRAGRRIRREQRDEQLAGLLAVVILPAVAGLAGVTIGSSDFAAGYGAALRAAAAIAMVAIFITR